MQTNQGFYVDKENLPSYFLAVRFSQGLYQILSENVFIKTKEGGSKIEEETVKKKDSTQIWVFFFYSF